MKVDVDGNTKYGSSTQPSITITITEFVGQTSDHDSGPREAGCFDASAPLLLTVAAAAALLGIGRTTTNQLVMSGQLKSVQLGRRRLVVRASLQEYIQMLLDEKEESEELTLTPNLRPPM